MGSSPPTDDTEDGSDDDDGAGVVDWDDGKSASDGETPELRRGQAAGDEGDTASNPGSGPDDSMAETTGPSRIARAENSAIGGDSCHSSSCWTIGCTLSRRVCSCRVIVGSTRRRSGLAPGRSCRRG